MGMDLHRVFFVLSCVCCAVAFMEEPSGGRSDGFCERIPRAQIQRTRKEGHHEFRLKVEGEQENYNPGTTYKVLLLATSPAYFRGFTLIALKEGTEGTTPDDYIGQFQDSFIICRLQFPWSEGASGPKGIIMEGKLKSREAAVLPSIHP